MKISGGVSASREGRMAAEGRGSRASAAEALDELLKLVSIEKLSLACDFSAEPLHHLGSGIRSGNVMAGSGCGEGLVVVMTICVFDGG